MIFPRLSNRNLHVSTLSLFQIGAFFMINLCLVVIATQFSETKKREMERMIQERKRFHSTSTLASNSEPGSCYDEIIKYIAHLWRRARRKLNRVFRRNHWGQRKMAENSISLQRKRRKKKVPPSRLYHPPSSSSPQTYRMVGSVSNIVDTSLRAPRASPEVSDFDLSSTSPQWQNHLVVPNDTSVVDPPSESLPLMPKAASNGTDRSVAREPNLLVALSSEVHANHLSRTSSLNRSNSGATIRSVSLLAPPSGGYIGANPVLSTDDCDAGRTNLSMDDTGELLKLFDRGWQSAIVVYQMLASTEMWHKNAINVVVRMFMKIYFTQCHMLTVPDVSAPNMSILLLVPV